jgi:hypothetical protein
MQRSAVIHSSIHKAGNGQGHDASAEKISTATFAEKFCVRHGVAPEKYEEVVLKRSLYPAARLLRPVMLLKANYFAADREFIRGVGRLTRSSGFDSEAHDYLDHPNNRGFLRRVFKLRVSGRRLRRMVRDLMEQGPGNK